MYENFVFFFVNPLKNESKIDFEFDALHPLTEAWSKQRYEWTHMTKRIFIGDTLYSHSPPKVEFDTSDLEKNPRKVVYHIR